jgi:hypothetical protein
MEFTGGSPVLEYLLHEQRRSGWRWLLGELEKAVVSKKVAA